MLSPRWRPVFFSILAVLAIWLVALAGYRIAKSSTMTADKLRAYVESVDLSKLSGSARAKAIQRLVDKLNALPIEERQKARMERIAWGWFEQMTEAEKSGFIEATMPSGFKQMLTAFDELSEEQRRRAIGDTLRRLKESRDELQAGAAVLDPNATNAPIAVSPELQAKIRTLGLKAFYSQSSAQTKAELAPVLEELQRVMESGRPFRGERR